jgi:hypothetical protein
MYINPKPETLPNMEFYEACERLERLEYASRRREFWEAWKKLDQLEYALEYASQEMGFREALEKLKSLEYVNIDKARLIVETRVNNESRELHIHLASPEKDGKATEHTHFRVDLETHQVSDFKILMLYLLSKRNLDGLILSNIDKATNFSLMDPDFMTAILKMSNTREIELIGDGLAVHIDRLMVFSCSRHIPSGGLLSIDPFCGGVETWAHTPNKGVMAAWLREAWRMNWLQVDQLNILLRSYFVPVCHEWNKQCKNLDDEFFKLYPECDRSFSTYGDLYNEHAMGDVAESMLSDLIYLISSYGKYHSDLKSFGETNRGLGVSIKKNLDLMDYFWGEAGKMSRNGRSVDVQDLYKEIFTENRFVMVPEQVFIQQNTPALVTTGRRATAQRHRASSA